MLFCTECGNNVEDSAKFCGRCGKKLGVNPQELNSYPYQSEFSESKRSTVYEGDIHKCPNCGLTLSSFVKKCPECDYELRGVLASYSVKEFSEKYEITSSNSKRVDLIRTFVIPNTKEDILEFAILALSNIDTDSYSKDNLVFSGGVSQRDVSTAWMAKFEQAQQKANILLTDDPYLEKINKLYSDKKKEFKNARTMSIGKTAVSSIFGSDIGQFMIVFIPLMMFMVLLPSLMFGGGERKLEKQVKQVETYIVAKDYDAALTTAYAMSDNYSDSWTETRANLINRIKGLKAQSEGDIVDKEGKVQFPSKKLVGKQVSDVVSILTSAGFSNVTKEPVKKEVLTGWMDKLFYAKEEVAEISIDGSTDYTKGEMMKPDTQIIVRYYE